MMIAGLICPIEKNVYTWIHNMYTFWESNMAMENRFMDEFPMKTSIDRGFPVAMFGW